ncbi:DNA polymerase III subunit chi [Erythrobacter sp. MTPC3]|uniref:DNA polymerase III subunit chi n=1 Tax=Erythrobacter sp. MTPC3 TaxID=3056564 RepID=UPI0036F23A91
MKVDFWQLSRDPAEKVCALIAERVLGSGERMLVVSADAEQREAISKSLWKSGPTSFLANEEAGTADDTRQPVLIAADLQNANGATHVIYADGHWRDADGFARSFLLFDDTTVEQARATWRSLDGKDGLERAFFRQEDGRWIKVA